jgi:hypothetical protein
VSDADIIPSDLPDPGPATPEQVELITAILKRERPVECDIAGNANVQDAARGAKFAEVKEGHHMAVLALLLALGDLVKVVREVISFVEWMRNRGKSPDTSKLIEVLRRRYAGEASVSKLIDQDPTLLERIVKDVATMLPSKSKSDSE